jgi:DNA mismatch repair ATPase MutS
LQFEYRLEPGPATTRNAIALLRQRGAPDSVIASALRRVAALEHQRSRAVSETP